MCGVTCISKSVNMRSWSSLRLFNTWGLEICYTNYTCNLVSSRMHCSWTVVHDKSIQGYRCFFPESKRVWGRPDITASKLLKQCDNHFTDRLILPWFPASSQASLRFCRAKLTSKQCVSTAIDVLCLHPFSVVTKALPCMVKLSAFCSNALGV